MTQQHLLGEILRARYVPSLLNENYTRVQVALSYYSTACGVSIQMTGPCGQKNRLLELEAHMLVMWRSQIEKEHHYFHFCPHVSVCLAIYINRHARISNHFSVTHNYCLASTTFLPSHVHMNPFTWRTCSFDLGRQCFILSHTYLLFSIGVCAQYRCWSNSNERWGSTFRPLSTEHWPGRRSPCACQGLI